MSRALPRSLGRAAGFALLLGLAAVLLVPAGAGAKSTVGLILPLCCEFSDATRDEISRQLQAEGVAAGDFEILVQRPQADKVSLRNSIRKLLAYDADLLMVFGASAAVEAADETKKVPVIFLGAYDPVTQGLVKTPERPGKNLTGVSCKTSLSHLLDNIKETTPVRNLGVIHHSNSLDSLTQLEELKTLADKKSLSLTVVDMNQVSAEQAIATLQPTQFIFLAAGCYPDFVSAAQLAALPRPVASQCANSAEAGVVFSLAADPEELTASAAGLAARVLRGQKPGDLAVRNISKIDFVINMKAAARHGLNIPFSVLSRATRLIK